MPVDQSCKECRRRKAKCDRGIPTCGLCGRYGRHCLYEKHSRTPLTRRHLTDVEEKLERAEALIRVLRRNQATPGPGPRASLPDSLRGHLPETLRDNTGTEAVVNFSRAEMLSDTSVATVSAAAAATVGDAARPSRAGPSGISSDLGEAGGSSSDSGSGRGVEETQDGCRRSYNPYLTGQAGTAAHTNLGNQTPLSLPSAPPSYQSNGNDRRASAQARHSHGPGQPPPLPLPVGNATATITNRNNNPHILESPPKDDFEWDEQDVNQSPGHSSVVLPHGTDADGDPVSDGMASLTVSVRETGYLGVASGAAMLRILEPKTTPRTARTSLWSSNAAQTSVGNSSNSDHDGRRRPQQRHPQAGERINSPYGFTPPLTATVQPDVNRHITDAMIDAYFGTYHLSYPILHEPTFRAQYAEVVRQPHGRCWAVLAYTVAAIGVYASSCDAREDLDLRLFAHARALLSFDLLEVGNLTLVQALTLVSNYQQKRGKPNSGYNYLGLAVRMATGLGLHKEFPDWPIAPLTMEIRRRVWWALCVFDVGATITFSRPMVWPHDGVEVAYPLNVFDRDLTANSRSYPPERGEVTPYTAVRTQAAFHVATNAIYARVISKPLPGAAELLRLDRTLLQPWTASLPAYFCDGDPHPAGPSSTSARFATAHAIMRWRLRNLRIIMYRPFVIRWALRSARKDDGNGRDSHNGRDGRDEPAGAGAAADEDEAEAISRCLEDARSTITSISEYWAQDDRPHNRIAAWYALYFLFQASLIPCICLRSFPASPKAPGWCEQVSLTLRTIRALATANSSSPRCYRVIMELCGAYIGDPSLPPSLDDTAEPQTSHGPPLPPDEQPPPRHSQSEPVQEQPQQQNILPSDNHGAGNMTAMDSIRYASHMQQPLPPQPEHDAQQLYFRSVADNPQTQISHIFPMMWPNATAMEVVDEVMGDDAWMEFLRGSAMGGDALPPPR